MKKIEAFAYLRVSGKGQVSGDGLVRQKRSIIEYARLNRIKISQFFLDEGVSGTLSNRPALANMLIDLKLSGVNTVIIEKIDRLARDLMVQEGIIVDFKKKGLKLISVCEGTDIFSDDPTRKLIRQILGAFSEYDKQMTVLKLMAARNRKRTKLGKCEGRKGYKEIAPEVILEIKKLRRKPRGKKSMTFNQIAEILNNNEFRTVSNKKFTGNNVSTLLHRSGKF